MTVLGKHKNMKKKVKVYILNLSDEVKEELKNADIKIVVQEKKKRKKSGDDDWGDDGNVIRVVADSDTRTKQRGSGTNTRVCYSVRFEGEDSQNSARRRLVNTGRKNQEKQQKTRKLLQKNRYPQRRTRK